MPPSSSIGGNIAVGEPLEVPADLEQVALRDVGRVHELVAALLVAPARVVLHDHADQAAARMEDREPRADLLREREQVELGAQLAVVAALGLLEPLQVRLEVVLGRPRGAVDPGQLRVLLVAAPVGAARRRSA